MENLTGFLSGKILSLQRDVLKLCIKNPQMAPFFISIKKSLENSADLREKEENSGLHVPPFLIASITKTCNLHCTGCYSRAFGSIACGGKAMETGEWRRIFREAAGLGVSFILLAGGEPLMRKDIISLAAEFPELVFPVFTNGTMLDDEYVSLFKKNRNLIPVLSIEGGKDETNRRRGQGVYEKLEAVMGRLSKNNIFYGASVTVAASNITEVTSDGFVANMSKRGCRLIFYVEYVPVDGPGEAITDRQRDYLKQRMEMIKKNGKIAAISFPGDEDKMGGCLAAGRGFFHINADGGAEPCPFSPYSDFSLRNGSLRDALKSGLFMRLRSDGLLNEPHEGGCLLWQKRGQVEALIKKQ